MASTNPILSQGVVGTECNWKMQIPIANRQKVVTKIGEWLIQKKFVHPQEAPRAQYMASKFEEKIFSIATSKGDYSRMIAIKLKEKEKAQQQQSLTSSAPRPPYIAESFLHQEMEERIPQTSNSVVDDWKEELYSKITKLKESFLAPLMIQQGKVATLVQKMDSISHQRSSSEYVKLQKLFGTLFKVISFLNFSKDRMSEEVLRHFPECEKLIFYLLQVKSQGQISSPQQKKFTSEAQFPKMPVLFQYPDKEQEVTARLEDSRNQQPQTTKNLVPSINWMQGVETKREKFVHGKQLGNSLLSNNKLRKSQPVPTSRNSSIVKIPVKENQSIGANNGDIRCQATFSGQAVEEGNENLRKNSATDLCEPRVPEEPIQRLIKAVKSMSHSFSVCVNDMKSVVRMVESCNDSKFVAGEDMPIATPFSCGKKRVYSSQTTQGTEYATAIPYKRPRLEANWNLFEEITEINLKLIETVVDISQNDVISATKESFTKTCDEGTVVKCCYTPVGTSPHLKSELASLVRSPIMPLKLLVPNNYPASSPVLLDKLPSEISMDCKDLSTKARLKLIPSLQILRQPMSLTDIARTWDTCARAVIFEFARKLGGGDFSSETGSWSAPLPIQGARVS